MLKKLDFTDKHLSAICAAAELGGIAAFGIACGIMYNAQAFLAAPAGSAVAGVAAYLIALWLHTGTEDRLGREADYADGYNAARRKLIEAGWHQAMAPEPVESVLPAELMIDADALVIDHEEAARAHQAAADRVRTITRGLAGVNLYVSELQIELAHAQTRAARAEGALDEIRGGLARYAYAPAPQAAYEAEAPTVAPAAAGEPQDEPAYEEPVPVPTMTLQPIVVADNTPPVQRRPGAEILISPPDDGEPIPAFLTEPREIPLDERTTAHALARMAHMLNSTSLPAQAGT